MKYPRFFLVVTLILTSTLVYATDSNFEFRYQDGEPVFLQRIMWETSPYAIAYTISLQDESGEELTTITTKEAFIELSLSAGNYLYKIATTNILGQTEVETPWQNLVIKKAYVPRITRITPGTIFLEYYEGEPIFIRGNDISPEARILFRSRDTATPTEWQASIRSVEKEGIRVDIPETMLLTGEYDIWIYNPGDIYTSTNFSVRFIKAVDFHLTLGYATLNNPPLESLNKQFSQDNYFQGLSSSLEVLFWKNNWGFIGGAVSFDYNHVEEQREVTLNGDFYHAALSLGYFKNTTRTFTLFTKAGLGLQLSKLEFLYGNNEINKVMLSLDPTVVAEVGFRNRFFRSLTLGMSLEYQHTFYQDSNWGTLRPSVFIGYYL